MAAVSCCWIAMAGGCAACGAGSWVRETDWVLCGPACACSRARPPAPPVAANLINSLWPLLIVLFAGLLPGEQLGGRQVVGALAGFGGAALLVTGGGKWEVDGKLAERF